MSYPFSFSLLTSLSDNTAPEILIEVVDSDDLVELSHLGIQQSIIDEVEANLAIPEEDRESLLTFHIPYWNAKKISFLFVQGTDCEEGRCDILRGIKTDFTYVSFQEKLTEVLDNLILTTYRFQKFLSKKKDDPYITLSDTSDGCSRTRCKTRSPHACIWCSGPREYALFGE